MKCSRPPYRAIGRNFRKPQAHGRQRSRINPARRAQAMAAFRRSNWKRQFRNHGAPFGCLPPECRKRRNFNEGKHCNRRCMRSFPAGLWDQQLLIMLQIPQNVRNSCGCPPPECRDRRHFNEGKHCNRRCMRSFPAGLWDQQLLIMLQIPQDVGFLRSPAAGMPEAAILRENHGQTHGCPRDRSTSKGNWEIGILSDAIKGASTSDCPLRKRLFVWLFF